MKEITILGSTGSVGTQSFDVAEKFGVCVHGISFNKNVDIAEAQARKMNIKTVATADESAARDLRVRLADTATNVVCGKEAIEELASDKVDRVFNSITGCAGLPATLAAIRAGNTLALANKESLVSAGDIVMREAKEKGVTILPVDSEHCAIHECLRSGERKEVKKLILTASGGPFFGMSANELETVTVEKALKHPSWSMGAKITVDSATLMNKGFEIIEAAYLFGMPSDKIDVVVHRQSIIHSMVEYIDNAVIAQLSVPDMRHCAQYALTYPDRLEAAIDELDLTLLSGLTFAKPDTEAFPMLGLAREVLKRRGGTGAAVNSANETAVWSFIRGEIKFTDIYKAVAYALDKLGAHLDNIDTLDGIYAVEKESEKLALEYIKSRK